VIVDVSPMPTYVVGTKTTGGHRANGPALDTEVKLHAN